MEKMIPNKGYFYASLIHSHLQGTKRPAPAKPAKSPSIGDSPKSKAVKPSELMAAPAPRAPLSPVKASAPFIQTQPAAPSTPKASTIGDKVYSSDSERDRGVY